MPTYQRIRQWKRHDPPSLIVMMGCDPTWLEASAAVGRKADGPVVTRRTCPNNCAHRDLARERWLGLDVVCLRCLTWSGDPEDWSPRATLACVIAEARARTAARRAASFAARRFEGRKASKRAASG